jgi:hypothetical protein
VILAATVQTSGINWESVFAISASVCAIMVAVVGAFVKIVGNQITRAIDKLRIDVLSNLEQRLAVVEAIIQALRKEKHD